MRDRFKIPKADHVLLTQLKLRARKLSSPARKNALLRAGIRALATMQDATFLAAVNSVAQLKTAGPKKS